MAIYHLSIKIITRGKGKSAVAAAAYRAAETITNDYDGVTHDYTNKCGIVHTEIMLPQNAPSEYTNRSVLWNSVEKTERYKTAQLAREIELALPVELSQEQQITLVRDYVKTNFVNAGMCADVCVHDKGDGNPHAHIMLTMRPINMDGSWGAKSHTVDGKKIPTVDWNEQSKAEEWRAAWSVAVNTFFKNNNIESEIDHRSYERQGIEQIPTVHLGVSATRLERRGIRTELGDKNREIGVSNQNLRRLNARIRKLQSWLREEAVNTTPPTLYDVICDILEGQGQTSVSRLNAASQMLIFLQRNEISDLSDLEKKVKSMRGKVTRLREELKPIERRIEALNEHIRQAEIVKEHGRVYKMYSQEKPKERAAFFEQFRMELTLYETADRYLKGVLNGRNTIPLKAWKSELTSKIAERDALYREYNLLKSETQKVEQIKRSAEEILREGARGLTTQKSWGMEL